MGESNNARTYRVEETLTVVGIGHVVATSKRHALDRVMRGEVALFYNDGQDVRRGDGIKAYLEPEAAPGE